MQASKIHLMEVCGTHTMAIAKAGIKSLLPDEVTLVSGPGCPVCVTPQSAIDEVLELSEKPNVILTTYGDMVRVPGSTRGDSLALRKAKGAHVEIVYSPLDSIAIAKDNPDKEVVFLGVGFETTAPGTAALIQEVSRENVPNVSLLSLLKTVEPALRALIADPEFNIQGFLCPGHVASILGTDGFRFLAEEYNIPGAIAGFEAEDIETAIAHLIQQIAEKRKAEEAGHPETFRASIENLYRRAVKDEGNLLARKMIADYLEPVDSCWRGLGIIPKSGLAIRREFAGYDAAKRFDLRSAQTTEVRSKAPVPENEPAGCRCGEVIKGKCSPETCPLFGKVCTPIDPVGPCMVSSEGACAAAYKYGNQ